MRVLVTRPEQDARRTAERLRTLGHEAAIDSVLAIEAVPFEPVTGRFDAVAITSANAVRVVPAEFLRPFLSLPLFAVGAHSGEAARAAGFGETAISEGDAVSLAKTMTGRLRAKSSVLYLAGKERAHDLAALVRAADIEVVTRAVYRAAPASALRADTLAFIRGGRIGAVLHYSARSAGIFRALAEQAGITPETARLRHLCLSKAAANPLAEAGFRVEIAARPHEDALFALLG